MVNSGKCPTVSRALLLALAFALSGYYLQYDVAYPRAVAQMGGLVSPTYRDQLDAIEFVSQHSGSASVQLLQNNGTDKIDFQILYLIAMVEGNATRLRHTSEESKGLPTYMLNRADHVPPAGYPEIPLKQFGRIAVYYRDPDSSQ